MLVSKLQTARTIIKTKKALATMVPGQVLRVYSTDSGSQADMPVFAEQSGDTLLHAGEEGGRYVFFLKKG